MVGESLQTPPAFQKRLQHVALDIIISKRTRAAVFVVVLLVAFAARLFHLETNNLWYDEVARVQIATAERDGDIHPPFYYMLLSPWVEAGRQEFWLRFPSVLAGMLSIVMVYHLGWRLIGKWMALGGALLTAFSPLLIWYSQDTNIYSLIVLECLLLMFWYRRLVDNRGSERWNWVGYGVVMVAGMYTHLYFLLMPLTFTLHVLVCRRDLLLKWVLAHVGFAVLYIPWLLVLLRYVGTSIGTPRPFNITYIPYTYYAFTVGQSFGPTVDELRSLSLRSVAPYALAIFPITVAVMLLSVVGAFRLIRMRGERGVLILMMAFVPVFVAVFIPLVYPPMTFNVRYVLYSIPPFLWVLVNGARTFNVRIGQVLLVCLSLYTGLSLYNYYFEERYQKEDVRSAAYYVETNASPDDPVLVITVSGIFKWYFTQDNPVYGNQNPEFAAAASAYPQDTAPMQALVDSMATGDTLWLVQSRVFQTDPRETARAYLDSTYTLEDVEEFHNVTVYQYCVRNCLS